MWRILISFFLGFSLCLTGHAQTKNMAEEDAKAEFDAAMASAMSIGKVPDIISGEVPDGLKLESREVFDTERYAKEYRMRNMPPILDIKHVYVGDPKVEGQALRFSYQFLQRSGAQLDPQKYEESFEYQRAEDKLKNNAIEPIECGQGRANLRTAAHVGDSKVDIRLEAWAGAQNISVTVNSEGFPVNFEYAGQLKTLALAACRHIAVDLLGDKAKENINVPQQDPEAHLSDYAKERAAWLRSLTPTTDLCLSANEVAWFTSKVDDPEDCEHVMSCLNVVAQSKDGAFDGMESWDDCGWAGDPLGWTYGKNAGQVDTEFDLKVNSVVFADANPIYSRDEKTLPENWQKSLLATADVLRDGTTADGISRLIIRADISEPKKAVLKVAEGDGTLVMLNDGEAITLQGKHYVIGLYTPPDKFDPEEISANKPKSPLTPPKQRLDEGLEYRPVTVNVYAPGESSAVFAEDLILTRPPVVLVHGLFSDPIQTWVQTFDDGAAMVAVLERAGFLPFLVNYQNSNGTETTGESWLTGDANETTSTFKGNARVVWESPLKDYTPIIYETGFLREAPIMSELQKSQDIRIGGISEALTYYREELNIASTQAIVIGHSMGGLLARVWASEAYNPEYKRAENFMEGDIDRLLTLNTPHHGSELMELKDTLLKAEIAGESWSAWARRQLVNTVLWWYALDPEPGAVSDLRPGSRALKTIGATQVPSYAIATHANSGHYGSTEKDPFQHYNALYSFAGLTFFNNPPLLDEFITTRHMRWRNTATPFKKTTDFKGSPSPFDDTEGSLQAYKDMIYSVIDSNVYYWANIREVEYRQDLQELITNTLIAPYGLFTPSMGDEEDETYLLSLSGLASQVVAGGDVRRFMDDHKTADTPDTFLSILRDLVFHNDPYNDGAVRVVSQRGGLDASEIIENVVHSYSPWDYSVQRRVLFLLKWEQDNFSDDGFPEAGQLTPRYLPSDSYRQDRAYGDKAVRWSGMVESHADQYLAMADRHDALVLVRPVNQDSTALLDTVAAAKGMNVKGKSSNWGPQVAYIPVDQRYSKIWRIFNDPDVRAKNVKKYNAETESSQTKKHPKLDRPYAVKRPLQIDVNGQMCNVLTDPNNQDAEQSIAIKCADEYFDWRNAQDEKGLARFDATAPMTPLNPDAALANRYEANPMFVLADNTQTNGTTPYLTADYDLLAIGFFEGGTCDTATRDGCSTVSNDVSVAEFDKLRGFIGERQLGLLNDINKAVRDNAGFKFGDVSHHGPEVQYPGSPYVDYPILVFDPKDPNNDADAEAYIIRQGPPGFRDIHLKRLFAEKIRIGFNLWPNPTSEGWLWEDRRSFYNDLGYDPRDAAGLMPYVEEAPGPAD